MLQRINQCEAEEKLFELGKKLSHSWCEVLAFQMQNKYILLTAMVEHG
jgi:hypothetical protein